MAILSKCLTSRVPRLGIGARSSGQPGALSAVSAGTWILVGAPNLRRRELVNRANVRFFRWDAKPDNQFGHSFGQGFFAKVHPMFYMFGAVFLIPFINWKSVLGEGEDSYLPKIVKFCLVLFSGGANKAPKPDALTRPSSFAGDIYDKYGEEGVDALKAAWEEVKEREGSPEQKMAHAVMMAEAAARYKKEVAEQAKELGLEDEVQDLLKDGDGAPPAKSILAGFSLKAEEEVTGEIGELGEDGETDLEERRTEKIGFRDRKIIEYENRIRQYSTPDKVFRYFSTYRITDEKGNGEVMMTPEDFLRSISPGEKQPEHLGLDQYRQVETGDIGHISHLQNLDKDSIFYQLGSGGLISFSDYIFLLTVLSTSRRHFQIAFKMFDLNGDGTVDAEEFEQVTTLLRSSSSTGARHRDHGTTGNTFKGINSGLITYFFGEKKDGTLTVGRFLEFQRSLQEEILALEFRRKDDQDRGRISERDFADLLIAYAGFSNKKKTRMLRRVRKLYEVDGESSHGISLKDYLNFYQVLYCINDIDTALTFHTIAGAPIERSTMKHVSRTVAHVELSDHLLDVVFTLFDDNGDGKLSNKEFISVMKQRAKRGLEKPKEIGISRIFSSVFKCAADCKPAIVGGVRRTE